MFTRCFYQITLRHTVKRNEILANVASNRDHGLFVSGRRERRTSKSEASFKDKCRVGSLRGWPGRTATRYERVYRVTGCSWLRGPSPSSSSDTKGNRLITPSVLTSPVAERLWAVKRGNASVDSPVSPKPWNAEHSRMHGDSFERQPPSAIVTVFGDNYLVIAGGNNSRSLLPSILVDSLLQLCFVH